MRQAVELGIIERNPCSNVVIKKFEAETSNEIHYWEKEHVQRFLQTALETDNMIYYYFFKTLIYTGMRKGEAMALQWDDIDFEKGEISINKTLTYHLDRKKEGSFGPPKTKASKRTIDLEQSLAADLKKLRLEQMKNKMKFGSAYSKLNFVFCKSDGSRLKDRTLHTAFERIKKKAGVS
jgi:integrase